MNFTYIVDGRPQCESSPVGAIEWCSLPNDSVPLIGHTSSLHIFIDSDLLQHDVVWAAAGTWNDVFPITPNDLVRASGAVVTDLKRI